MASSDDNFRRRILMTAVGGFHCVALAVVGCASENSPSDASSVTSSSTGDHHEMDDAGVGHDEHFVRDPAIHPCDVGNWRGYIPDLRECVLPGENLDKEILRRVDFTDADLTGTSFVEADLFKSIFVRAKLVNANFTKASLVSVDLTNADLTGANLRGADMTNAVMANAILNGSVTDETTVCPNIMSGPCW